MCVLLEASIAYNRLNDLAILAIECDLSKSLDYDSVVDKFYATKSTSYHIEIECACILYIFDIVLFYGLKICIRSHLRLLNFQSFPGVMPPDPPRWLGTKLPAVVVTKTTIPY